METEDIKHMSKIYLNRINLMLSQKNGKKLIQFYRCKHKITAQCKTDTLTYLHYYCVLTTIRDFNN